MRILISGASGFVGTHLVPFLRNKNHEIATLVRSKKSIQPGQIYWDPALREIDKPQVNSFAPEAVINLTGESILGVWTDEKKKKMFDSRIGAINFLTETISTIDQKPKVFVHSSGIGYFGFKTPPGVVFDESYPRGDGFLAKLAEDWENSAKTNNFDQNCRVVALRFGNVLQKEGGMLGSMLMPFKAGVGGVIGSGNQRMPWVSMNDVLRVVEFVLTNDKISGPVVVAEEKTITNYEFTKTLGKILNRPTLVWTPEFLLKLIAKPVFGELVEEGLLSDLETFPKKLTDNGFYFEDTNLERYLKTQV